ncbi:MAG: hypothetical protein IJO97_08145 [Lachnospiraceae bacterium]|nr:hypothetical protein [Lachnospiraceae bacterium]
MTYQQQTADAAATQIIVTMDVVPSSGSSFYFLSAATTTTMAVDAAMASAFSTTIIPTADVPGFGSFFCFVSVVMATLAANYLHILFTHLENRLFLRAYFSHVIHIL